MRYPNETDGLLLRRSTECNDQRLGSVGTLHDEQGRTILCNAEPEHAAGARTPLSASVDYTVERCDVHFPSKCSASLMPVSEWIRGRMTSTPELAHGVTPLLTVDSYVGTSCLFQSEKERVVRFPVGMPTVSSGYLREKLESQIGCETVLG